MSKIPFATIVAMAENHVIGRDNAMPWHIPADLKHFKKLTMGKPIIMGRKCFDSIVDAIGKPLPGRPQIIMTRNPDALSEKYKPSNSQELTSPDSIKPAIPSLRLHYVKSLKEAENAAIKIAEQDDAQEIIIAGGGEIYKQMLPRSDKFYLTLIHQNYEGDTYFPEFDWNDWDILEEEKHGAAENQPAFTFFTLMRKNH